MRLWNTIEFTHMTLRLVPKILNPVDVILLVCKEFRMVDSEVMKIRNVQYIVGSPTVRIDNAVRNDLTLDNRDQSF